MEPRPQLTHPSVDAVGPVVSGGFVDLPGEGLVYRIGSVDKLPPFMVTVTSPDDHWLFVSTSGGMTCGRVDPSRALFPYETDDRLHRAGGLRGAVTLLRVRDERGETLWAPFRGATAPGVTRNLYKSQLGDRLLFEEVNDVLGISVHARWATSRLFGVVRTVTLWRHEGRTPAHVAVLDGVLDLQPALVPLSARQTMSNLVDSYTRCERVASLPLMLCALEARIVDRPEPAEALRTNLVWSVGLGGMPGATAPRVSLREDSVLAFSAGRALDERPLLTGARGAFFQAVDVVLESAAPLTWHLVGEVHADQRAVAMVAERLEAPASLARSLEADLEDGARRLRKLVASVDGLQLGADFAQTVAHGSSALFSTMRGGVFSDGHLVPADDLRAFIKARSVATWTRQRAFLEAMGDGVIDRVLALTELREDPDLTRLVYEYLPLWFSRRHGDPSRPWNQFAIRLLDAGGRRRLDWQGNWRDIFQNWETLCESYPAFSLNTVVTFLDASSADGGNPYRVSRAGLDWEVPDPDDPWSHIGYWGDHQIVYLLKLLELTRRNQPGRLEALLDRALFTYADIPYRIAPFDALLDNPHETITFDFLRHHDIERRRAVDGADACLLGAADGQLVRVTLVEKLLVPLLSKLCNLVVDGGVWMNTQRPEWNDANNALVGWGLSVVTAAHLRRFCVFFEGLIGGRQDRVALSREVAQWTDAVLATLRSHRGTLTRRDVGDNARQAILSELGGAFSRYRDALYASGLSAPEPREAADLAELLALTRDYLDHTLRANRREDGLFHAYNVMARGADGLGIGLQRLPLMLEGQVALLDSGLVPPAEAADMLDALFASDLYREDQQSFVLYPPVVRPAFLDKNTLPRARVASVKLLTSLVEVGDPRLIVADADKRLRFAADLTNARDLAAVLDALAAEPEWADAVMRDRDEILALWEEVFHHHTFTGRSGTMHGHEGIGCIYWHMVGKLHLAVAHAHEEARLSHAQPPLLRRLADHYHAIRRGLGPSKTPAEQGAFPTDPHSYTPPHRGAQQPGMTGQAKEAVLVRWRELGVKVEAGRLRLSPALLPERELVTAPTTFAVIDVSGVERRVEVPVGGFAFTFCQVPIVYIADARDDGSERRARVTCHWADGTLEAAEGETDLVSAAASQAILGRTGLIDRVVVQVPRQSLWRG